VCWRLDDAVISGETTTATTEAAMADDGRAGPRKAILFVAGPVGRCPFEGIAQRQSCAGR